MIDRETAYQIASNALQPSWEMRQSGDILVIIEKSTIEKEYGWIFFYNSKKYLKTKNSRHFLAGNGPIVVEKADGSVHRLGTAGGAQYQIDCYEARRNNLPLPKLPVLNKEHKSQFAKPAQNSQFSQKLHFIRRIVGGCTGAIRRSVKFVRRMARLLPLK